MRRIGKKLWRLWPAPAFPAIARRALDEESD
jgi:hypothetical protein